MYLETEKHKLWWPEHSKGTTKGLRGPIKHGSHWTKCLTCLEHVNKVINIFSFLQNLCLLNRLHDYYHASRYSQLLVYSQSVRPYSDQWDHRKSKEKLGGSTDGKKMKRRSYKGDCGGCSLLPFHERIREPSQTSTGWTHRINNQAWTTYLELCPVLSSTVLLVVRLHIPPCSPNFNKIASVSELFYTYRL